MTANVSMSPRRTFAFSMNVYSRPEHPERIEPRRVAAREVAPRTACTACTGARTRRAGSSSPTACRGTAARRSRRASRRGPRRRSAPRRRRGRRRSAGRSPARPPSGRCRSTRGTGPAALDGEDAEDRAPRLAHQVDLPLVEAPSQVLGHLDDVGHGPVEGHVATRIDRRVRLAVAALVQVDDDEVPGPRLAQHAGEREVGLAGPARQVEEHGLVGVGGADQDRLVRAADADGRELGDCRARGLPVLARTGGVEAGQATSTASATAAVPTTQEPIGHRPPPRVPSRRRASAIPASTPGRHRQDQQHAVHAARDDEGDHAVDVVEPELERRRRERPARDLHAHGGGEHPGHERPPGPREPAPNEPDRESASHREQRLTGRRGSARRNHAAREPSAERDQRGQQQRAAAGQGGDGRRQWRLLHGPRRRAPGRGACPPMVAFAR